MKTCKDCPEGSTRLAPHPGPRCATHWRAERKRRAEAAHGRHIEKTYGITLDEYEAIKTFQGGVCAICKRANGASKRLSVDHDHSTGQVRGLVCGPCNKLLGHARDEPEFFDRASTYLLHPPAVQAGIDRIVPLV